MPKQRGMNGRVCIKFNMHELSLCRALLAAAERALASQPDAAIAQLSVSVGALSGCEPALLRHVFPHAAQGSRFAKASLDIQFQAAQIHCQSCDQTHVVAPNRFMCPQCQSLAVRLVAGEGVFLTGIQLARPSPAAE